MRVFNAADRCDRCGAQARHAAVIGIDNELLFCNHHFKEHREALYATDWVIQSELSVDDTYPAPV